MLSDIEGLNFEGGLFAESCNFLKTNNKMNSTNTLTSYVQSFLLRTRIRKNNSIQHRAKLNIPI
jgi:hypothetical protein